MPTPTRRFVRRLYRSVDLLWLAGAIAWMAYILWTQRPWQGWDEAQTSEWLLVGIAGLLVGSLQKRGKDYWPANSLLGLAVGAVPVLYFVITNFVFQGDVATLRTFATTTHLGVAAWGFCLVLIVWALALVLLVNRARDGSSVNLWGQIRPPTEDQAIEALHVLARAHKHHVGNLLTQPEFAALAREFDREVWLRDPQQQLDFERARAAERIAAAERRVAAACAAGERI